ncbi:hypothetical protein LTR13_005244 [Exophiala sideris]|nr:hypothetical protein LTR13_005244 [Exophiala sideris]
MYNCYTPQETAEIVSRSGAIKGNMRLDKVFFSAVSAGCLLAFACATALSTNASPWYQENAPGLIRTISAIVFPYGLCSIVLTGADLCTGSFMTEAIKFATSKQVTPEWHQIFLRGIGANWLVCLACYLGMSGREYFSKIVGIWWPTFAFVSLGFDHVVANMFFVPMGIFQGADITVGLYIWKGIIPAGLGNIVGGFLFVGAYYWYQYLAFLPAPVIDGIAYEAVSPNGHVDFGARRKTGDEETLGGGN